MPDFWMPAPPCRPSAESPGPWSGRPDDLPSPVVVALDTGPHRSAPHIVTGGTQVRSVQPSGPCPEERGQAAWLMVRPSRPGKRKSNPSIVRPRWRLGSGAAVRWRERWSSETAVEGVSVWEPAWKRVPSGVARSDAAGPHVHERPIEVGHGRARRRRGPEGPWSPRVGAMVPSRRAGSTNWNTPDHFPAGQGERFASQLPTAGTVAAARPRHAPRGRGWCGARGCRRCGGQPSQRIVAHGRRDGGGIATGNFQDDRVAHGVDAGTEGRRFVGGSVRVAPVAGRSRK